MLEEFRVDNFKSLINVTFSPRECNLLLGVNNAGKTNLCQAMTFLAATVHKPLNDCADSVAGGRFGITNHYFDKETVDFQVKASVPFDGEELTFNYELTVSVKNKSEVAPSWEVETEQLHVTGSCFDNVALLENTRDGVRLLHEKDYLSKGAHYVETSSPRDATMLQRLYDLDTNPRANCFKKYLSWWQYYYVSPEAIRGMTRHLDRMGLATDGSNLASVVYLLKTRNERLYRKLLSQLQKIAPEVDVMNFFTAQDSIAMFFEDNRGNQIYAGNASCGTLRYLAMLYIVLAQPALVPRPLIVIEEPENGIYVGYLKELLGIFEESESRAQLIFTSHSPYFIDLFDNRLDSIFVLKRGEQHSSITQPDVDQVRKRLETFALGEQHFREMLG
ncbi:MAG: ATP-binding protein [Planctomycetes bacterium]|nr:ATP-binding protein [Planctomycetota bacterium]